MDVFKFHNPTNPLKMEQGEIINGLKTKMWVERYDVAGEFKFVADASLGLRNLLPIGSFVSHVDTSEIMLVENHEINDVEGQDSEIVVTGRGLETVYEQRIVGADYILPPLGPYISGLSSWPVPLDADYIHEQIRHLIAINYGYDDNNRLSYLGVITQLPSEGEFSPRTVKKGELYQAVLELLKIGGLGIKVVRPGTWSPFPAPGTLNEGGYPITPPDNQSYTAIMIHKGVDRSNSVIFSTDTGEIESADYLWSNKKLKNAAYILGKWMFTVILPAEVDYARRWMMVDAADLDQEYSNTDAILDAIPPVFDSLVVKMQQRGRDALASQNEVALTKAEVSKTTRKATYRKDFDLGDIITVHGNYNETAKMRVTEYVEIEDENGMSGHPTLTVL